MTGSEEDPTRSGQDEASDGVTDPDDWSPGGVDTGGSDTGSADEWIAPESDNGAGDPDASADAGDGSDGEADDWNPDEMEIDGEFAGDGTSGGAADVVTKSGEFLTEDYWFEGESEVSITPGTPFLWSMSSAGLYGSSFIFAAAGLQFVAPATATLYIEFFLSAAAFLAIPMVAYFGAGLGLEMFLAQGDGDLPETTIPIGLLLPVILHVVLFLFVWVDTPFTQALLGDMFGQAPMLTQLLLWPPVIMCSIFAMIAYRTTVGARVDEDSGAIVEFA